MSLTGGMATPRLETLDINYDAHSYPNEHFVLTTYGPWADWTSCTQTKINANTWRLTWQVSSGTIYYAQPHHCAEVNGGTMICEKVGSSRLYGYTDGTPLPEPDLTIALVIGSLLLCALKRIGCG